MENEEMPIAGDGASPVEGLNEKQYRFCQEYLIDLNATQAAIRAGYSKQSSYSIGYENLRKPQIRAYIEDQISQRSSRTLVHADYVVENLKEVIERALQQKPVMRYDPVEKSMVQEKEMVQDEDGQWVTVGVYEFDSVGANRALELLGKHMGIFTDKTDTKITGEIRTVQVEVIETGIPLKNSEKDVSV